MKISTMKPIDINDDSAPGCAAGAVWAYALEMKNIGFPAGKSGSGPHAQGALR